MKEGTYWRCPVCYGEPRFDEDGPYCGTHPNAEVDESALLLARIQSERESSTRMRL